MKKLLLSLILALHAFAQNAFFFGASELVKRLILSLLLCSPAFAGYTVFQTAACGRYPATIPCSFGSPTTAGNQIIAVYINGQAQGGASFAIADTSGNTWTNPSNPSSSGNAEPRIYFAASIIGGPDTVTVTATMDTPDIGSLFLIEVSGVYSFNASGANNVFGGGTISVSATTTVANTFVLSVAPNGSTITQNTAGVTQQFNGTLTSGGQPSGGSYVVGHIGTVSVAAIGAYSNSFTFSSGGGNNAVPVLSAWTLSPLTSNMPPAVF